MFICGHLVECYPVTFAFAICSDTLIFSFSLCNDFRPNVCYGHIVEAFLTYHYNIIVLFAVCNCGYSTSLNNTFKLHDAHKTTKIIFFFFGWLSLNQQIKPVAFTTSLWRNIWGHALKRYFYYHKIFGVTVTTTLWLCFSKVHSLRGLLLIFDTDRSSFVLNVVTMTYFKKIPQTAVKSLTLWLYDTRYQVMRFKVIYTNQCQYNCNMFLHFWNTCMNIKYKNGKE